MDESSGVAGLVKRFFDVLTGDAEGVPSLLAPEDPVIGIGTDPAEWWDGRDRLIEVITAQVQEMAGVQVEVGPVSAFEDGAVGWAVARPKFQFPDGNHFEGRLTVVGTKSGDDWRAVHFHISVGVGNEETVGQELTT